MTVAPPFMVTTGGGSDDDDGGVGTMTLDGSEMEELLIFASILEVLIVGSLMMGLDFALRSMAFS